MVCSEVKENNEEFGKIALGAHSAKSAVEAASVIPTHNKHTEILSSVETLSKVVRVKHFYFLGQA